jgi:hypothetical protein
MLHKAVDTSANQLGHGNLASGGKDPQSLHLLVGKLYLGPDHTITEYQEAIT